MAYNLSLASLDFGAGKVSILSPSAWTPKPSDMYPATLRTCLGISKAEHFTMALRLEYASESPEIPPEFMSQ